MPSGPDLSRCRYVPRASSPSDPYAGQPCGDKATVWLIVDGRPTARCFAHQRYGLVGKTVRPVTREAAVSERFIEVRSCRDCPYHGPTDGEAESCHHPVHPFRPKFGMVEDSVVDGTPPPPECPLREAPVVTRVEFVG